MITVLSKELHKLSVSGNAYIFQLACLSTDTKPTDNVANGSLCFEMDTGDFYYFDETATAWAKIGTSAE